MHCDADFTMSWNADFTMCWDEDSQQAYGLWELVMYSSRLRGTPNAFYRTVRTFNVLGFDNGKNNYFAWEVYLDTTGGRAVMESSPFITGFVDSRFRRVHRSMDA
jgi:hypothetical protein